MLTAEQLELCRQWFDMVEDMNPAYLNARDYKLAQLLYERLGMRVPHRIADQAEQR